MKGLLENESVLVFPPRPASREELLLFHEDDYVNLVKRLSEKGSGMLDMGDTPAFKGCYEATSLVVGASLVGCDMIMSGRVSHCFNPSGGLHHAHPERASGFCIFNDPAVTIAYLKSKHHIKRIVYLDIDAHHGDGVMYGYYADPAVLDIDFHESGRFLFPGTGFPDETGKGDAEGLKINIPLLPATGDQAYLRAFRELVPALLKQYEPEIILVQCGADGHIDDRLAHLRLTTRVYSEVVGQMHSLAHEICNGRLMLFGGGGYTLANVPRVWAVAFATLAGIDMSNEIPLAWSKKFKSQTDEEPPASLYDETTKDNQNTEKDVQRVLTELRSHLDKRVYPSNGF